MLQKSRGPVVSSQALAAASCSGLETSVRSPMKTRWVARLIVRARSAAAASSRLGTVQPTWISPTTLIVRAGSNSITAVSLSLQHAGLASRRHPAPTAVALSGGRRHAWRRSPRHSMGRPPAGQTAVPRYRRLRLVRFVELREDGLRDGVEGVQLLGR